MSTKRLGVAVAVLGGYLYAVGGSDGSSPLNSGGFAIFDFYTYICMLKRLYIFLQSAFFSHYI